MIKWYKRKPLYPKKCKNHRISYIRRCVVIKKITILMLTNCKMKMLILHKYFRGISSVNSLNNLKIYIDIIHNTFDCDIVTFNNICECRHRLIIFIIPVISQ